MFDGLLLVGFQRVDAGGDGVDLFLELREALLVLLAVFLHQFFIVLLHLLVEKVIVFYLL